MDKIIVAALIVLMGIGASSPTAQQPHETANGKITAGQQTFYDVEHIYSLSTTVTAVSENEITATDFNGNVWSWYDTDEDWFVGDMAALTLFDNCTPEIADDEIIGARYCGWVF